jgi:precorrin-6B methylase 1
MNKTIKFIQELRMQFTSFYEDFASMKGIDNIEFNWSETVFDDKSALIDVASKLSNAGFSKKFIMKHMGYSDAEIADELAIDLQNAEMMKRANILIGEGK